MRLACFLAVLAFASCSTVPRQDEQLDPGGRDDPVRSADNRVGLYVGQRYLDEGEWEPVDEQLALGIEYSHERPGSVIGWEAGFFHSSDDDDVLGFDVEVSTIEFYGGVRKTFGDGVVRPYVGGGLALITLEADISGVGDADDTSPAGYAHAGLAFRVSDSFHVGVDLRALFASDLDLAGIDTDADYEQLALMLGFAF